MYPVQDAFHNLSTADSPTTRCRIYFIPDSVDCTDDNDVITNGTLLKYENADTDSNRRIADSGVVFHDMFNSDRNIVVGGTVSKQVQIALVNFDGGLNGFDFGRCKLFVDVYDSANSTWLDCPMGVYLIEQPEKLTTRIVNASGYDQMQYLNKVADAWWSNIDWSGGVTVATLISQIATQCGVSVSSNLSSHILNGSNAYYEAPLTANQTTYRDILGWLGGVTGTIGYFDRDGALDMRWFKYATDETDTYSGNPVQFTGGSGDSISSLTVPLSPIQATVPAEYKTCEYIESTGTQRIDVGLKANQNTGFSIVYYTNDDVAGLGYGCIFGARQSGGVLEYQLTSYSTGSPLQGIMRYGNKTVNTIGMQKQLIQKVSVRNGVLTNANGVVSDLPANTFETPVNINLFTLNQNGSYVQSGSVRIYDFELYDGDTLVAHMVPCYRISDNVIGMYDIVRNAFFTNDGSGTFTKGSDSSFPNAYNNSPISGRTGVSVYVGPDNDPDNATEYAVDWTSPAGTVYGGTLDVVSGVLTVDRVKHVFDGTETNKNSMAGTYGYRYGFVLDGAKTPGSIPERLDFQCNIGKGNADAVTSSRWTPGMCLIYPLASPGSANFLFVVPLEYNTNELAAQYLIDNGLEICYPLATPLTYQLTPEEVEVLGQNNVWSNANSTITVSVDRAVTVDSDTLGNGVMALDLAEYTVGRIDMLEVLPADVDLTTAVGDGGNVYQIAGNPFLIGADDDAVNALATPIYDRLATVQLYFPMTIRLITDWSLEAGDVIKVINGGTNYVLPIMQQTMTWRGGFVLAEMLSSGDPERLPMDWEERTAYQNDVQMHEFENTVNLLRSQIRDLSGNYTLIQQTVDSITNIVSGQGQTIQSILDPTGQIWTAITTNSTSLTTLEAALNSEISTRQSYIRFIPSEPAIVLGVDTGNEIKLKLVNNIIYFFNGADDSTDLSLAYAYFDNEEAGADRFVAKDSVQIGNSDTANLWLFKILANGDLILDLI